MNESLLIFRAHVRFHQRFDLYPVMDEVYVLIQNAELRPDQLHQEKPNDNQSYFSLAHPLLESAHQRTLRRAHQQLPLTLCLEGQSLYLPTQEEVLEAGCPRHTNPNLRGHVQLLNVQHLTCR